MKVKKGVEMVLTKMRKLEMCLVFSGLLVFFILGCRKNFSDEEIRRQYSIACCKDALNNPYLPERARALAKEAIDKWNNNYLDPQPILINASLLYFKHNQSFALDLILSDEDEDVAGIGVREFHKDIDSRTMKIEEKYPVFGSQAIGGSQLPSVRIRNNPVVDRKDEEKWQSYLDNGMWDRDVQPDLWISRPIPEKLEVEVWVYDHAGHKSGSVALGHKCKSE